MTPSSANGPIASTEQVGEVLVALAVPDEHHVDDLVGVLADDLFAGVLLDVVAQVLIDVVVEADLHDDHARVEAHARGNAGSAGLFGARAPRAHVIILPTAATERQVRITAW